MERASEPRTAREQYWLAYAKIAIRRKSATVSRAVMRPVPDASDTDDIEVLHKELRRLRGEALRFEEDNRDLRERVAFLARWALDAVVANHAEGNVCFARAPRPAPVSGVTRGNGLASSADRGEVVGFPGHLRSGCCQLAQTDVGGQP